MGLAAPAGRGRPGRQRLHAGCATSSRRVGWGVRGHVAQWRPQTRGLLGCGGLELRPFPTHTCFRRPVHLPRLLGVHPRERRPRHHADPQVVELARLCGKIRDDVPQAAASCQLRHPHRHELAPAGHAPRHPTRLVLACEALELMSRYELEDLREYGIIVGHGLGSPCVFGWFSQTHHTSTGVCQARSHMALVGQQCLQVDQAEPEGEELRRNVTQRSDDAGLDCDVHISDPVVHQVCESDCMASERDSAASSAQPVRAPAASGVAGKRKRESTGSFIPVDDEVHVDLVGQQ